MQERNFIHFIWKMKIISCSAFEMIIGGSNWNKFERSRILINYILYIDFNVKVHDISDISDIWFVDDNEQI